MPPKANNPSDPLSELADRIGSANNILVTVSDSPSVDQLSSCIGLTLALNKMGKHGTAVFSGEVPSTLEFLQPEKTIETNTDSLRDFIISLDKSKADKLRYKVEDEYVKIFITPYRTSISDADLNFSQGDFNIDLVITLGVHERAHLDGAIIAHGRILHDATVASLTHDTMGELGSINWVEPEASSLAEMVSDLVNRLGKNLFDAQIATALLTGMVAETDRFGNEKARPHTMSLAGVLMAAGASPQLISSKLQEPEPESEEPSKEIPPVAEVDEPAEPAPVEEAAPEAPAEEPQPEPQPEPEPEKPAEKKDDDGSFKIEHDDDSIKIDEEGRLQAIKELEAAQAELEAEAQNAAQAAPAAPAAEPQPEQTEPPAEEPRGDSKRMVLEPPQLSGQLTANSVPEQYSPSTDPLSVVPPSPLLGRSDTSAADNFTPPEMPQNQTLSDLERSVNSPHLNAAADEAAAGPLPPDDARAAVENALDNTDSYRPEPINALGATPVDLNLGHEAASDAFQSDDLPKDSQLPSDENTPPPVPPPLMPPGV